MAGFALFTLLIFLGVLFLASAVVIHMAAVISAVPGATFGKALKSAAANIITFYLLNIVFSLIPGLGNLAATLISFAVDLWILKTIYNTGWSRSLLMWIFQIVVKVGIAIATAVIVGASIFAVL